MLRPIVFLGQAHIHIKQSFAMTMTKTTYRKTGHNLDQIQIMCVRNQNGAAHDLDYLIQIYRIGIII
jgi:hypothetical protein